MNILLTGGLGYIGSHVCSLLQERDDQIIIVDNLSNCSPAIINQLGLLKGFKNVCFEKVDVTNAVELSEVFKKHPDIQGVIHFAALKSVDESIRRPLDYYHNNVGGLVSLLQEVVKREIPFIFSSSCTVYGQAEIMPISETEPFKKSYSPYGTTKQMGEQILQDVNISNPKFKAMSLRYFNPIGAHESSLIGEWPIGVPKNLVPYITQVGIGKRDYLTVFGDDYPTSDGTCIRDYIHVLDLADAHIKGIEFLLENEPNYHVYNVGLGQGVSVKKMIDLFEKVSHKKIEYRIAPRRDGDVTEAFADNTKIKKELGWEPRYSIEEALHSAWRWEKFIRDSGIAEVV